MKKRTAFVGAILSLIPFGQPLLIKTSVVLSSSAVMLSLPEKVKASYIKNGNRKYAKGDYYGAIIDYSRAIEINPKNYNAYYNRGLAKHSLKDFDGAIDDYTKAIKYNQKEA